MRISKLLRVGGVVIWRLRGFSVVAIALMIELVGDCSKVRLERSPIAVVGNL